MTQIANSRRPIYLDYAATTPVDPRVALKMAQFLSPEGKFGNPASKTHVFGWEAEEAVEEARAQLAELLNCDAREIVWTSGATESDNLALKGIAEGAGFHGHLVTSVTEHKAVLDSCHYLETLGMEVTYLKPRADGRIDANQVAAAVRADTLLVSIMHANNEIGTINDVAAIASLTRARGILFHVDAAQSVGKVPIDLTAWPIDLLSVSGHKIYGPKGVGALFVRREAQSRLRAQMHGGGHERGMRSGTLATHQVVGLGEAAALCAEAMPAERQRLRVLRDRLLQHVQQLPDVYVNGSLEQRLETNLNVAFGGVDGETLVNALDDLAVSTGSACTSATVEPSYVLTALGLPPALAAASIRFTVGRFSTPEEIEQAGERVRSVVNRLRAQTD